ncbi:hexameric tyrosine-coordinated heme protein [Pseudoxanthomonas mexicana]
MRGPILRLVVEATQPDTIVRDRLRPQYAEDPAILIKISEVVMVEFGMRPATSP